MTHAESVYCGRFAPTPSGPLHFGSLVTAVASFLHAKTRNGRWLVRIEDVDTTRTVSGAAATILKQLEAAALYWDGEVVFQSERNRIYQDVLAELMATGVLFSCDCSRSRLMEGRRRAQDGSTLYPGTCRGSVVEFGSPKAIRLQAGDGEIVWTDTIFGRHAQNLGRDVGDFVLKRADGCFSYHLAVVVDDERQGVTTVVRGSDLLESTPRQIYLQNLLGFRRLSYAHMPLVQNEEGEKLSKQTRSPAVDCGVMSDELWKALRFLGQDVPAALRRESTELILAWAIDNWNEKEIPRKLGVGISDNFGGVL